MFNYFLTQIAFPLTFKLSFYIKKFRLLNFTVNSSFQKPNYVKPQHVFTKYINKELKLTIYIFNCG